MENVTAYDIALIGGGFTIVGALIGALSTYWLAIELSRIKERRIACAKLRAAFAPALAMIYLARHHGNHDRPDDHAFIKSELLKHAAAIEEFRAFIFERERSAYQEAWENYRKAANQDSYDRTGDEWARSADEKRGKSLKRKFMPFSPMLKPNFPIHRTSGQLRWPPSGDFQR